MSELEGSVEKFVTGIDDCGTMSGKSLGWGFISFNEILYDDFNVSARDILTRSKMKAFHAKEFTRKYRMFYTEFLFLIRETLEKNSNSILCVTMQDEKWDAEFSEFTERLVECAFDKAGVIDEDIVQASKSIAAPLFAFMRISSGKITADSTSIEIDSHALLVGLNKPEIAVENGAISSQIPIFAALRKYRDLRFPQAPLIEKNAIQVLNDEDSFLIQAVDVFANFSNAIIFKTLGKETKTNDIKCEIFNEVFGDIIHTSNIKDNIMLDGEDFVLKQSGSFTLCIL